MRLERRVAKALTDDNVTSSELADLFGELQAAITDAEKAAEEERKKALDPAASPDVKAAREAMQASEFACERLRTLLPRLEARFGKVQRAEKKAAWRRERGALAPRVDALAQEMKSIYREFTPKLVDVLSRARELNDEVRRLNNAKPYPEPGEPDDGLRLFEVENVARNFEGFGQHGLTLDRDLVLPDFDDPCKKLWPPYEVPWGVQYVESMLAQLQRRPPPGSQAEHELRQQHQREQADQLKAHYERQEKAARK
jgi:hypothetical protein